MTPHSDAEHQMLKNIHQSFNFDPSMEIWHESQQMDQPMDILVGPEMIHSVLERLAEHKMSASVQLSDLGEVLRDEEMLAFRPPFTASDDLDVFDFNSYHPHEEIIAYLKGVANKNSGFVQYDSLGQSFEGRELAYVKVRKITDAYKN